MNANLLSSADAPVVTAVARVDATSTVALSFTGRFGAFNTANPLLADDKNLASDIYVKNFDTGELIRASVSFTGVEANGGSSQPSLSASGRYLVFTSAATNLVPGDTNGMSDIFLKDLQTGAIKMVSARADGTPGNGASRSPDISADGRYVTYVSAATNLGTLEYPTAASIYVTDLVTGMVSMVSETREGYNANAISQAPDISGNGSLVAFSSFASNLAGNHTAGGTAYPYLKNLKTGELTAGWAMSTRPPVVLPVQAPMLSGDGTKVTVAVSGTVFFIDLPSNQASNISSGARGEYVNFATNRALSDDGRQVLFSAAGDDLLGGDDTAFIQLYVRDTATGALTRMSSSADGAAANASIGSATLSGDGKMTMFVSTATNLAGGSGEAQLLRAAVPTQGAPKANLYLSDVDETVTSLAAGAGHDTYFIGRAGTVVTELDNGGSDRIVSNVEGLALPAQVENLILGTALKGSGNELDNNLRGNAQNNELRGGAGDDYLIGLEGSDMLDGGAGRDVAAYSEWSFDLLVRREGSGFILRSKNSPNDTDTLVNVERIKLNDMMMALDVDGVGGKAYRIYEAAFDRSPDPAGLGFWINAMDRGVSLLDVAGGFMQSAEFTALYGAKPDNASLLTRMYNNILERDPDPAGHAFWLDLLERQVITPVQALAEFSESPENYAAVIADIRDGFFYAM